MPVRKEEQTSHLLGFDSGAVIPEQDRFCTTGSTIIHDMKSIT